MILSLTSATAGEVFTYIGYILLALVALMFMIVVHESGHYLAGKLLGFRIDEFGIGFGPPIIKKRNKKTGELFTVRPFPLGGFCAFHGEDEDENDIKEADKNLPYRRLKKGETDIVASQDGTAALPLAGSEPAPAAVKGADDGAFNRQKPWKRLIVLFSGALFNFLSAIFIITIYFTAYGQILPVVTDVYAVNGVENVFRPGDAILAKDGMQVNIMTGDDVTSAFEGVKTGTKFKILRDGETMTVTVTVGDYVLGDKYLEEGESAERKGVGVVYGVQNVKLGFFRSFGRSFGFSFFIVFKILASLGALLTGQIGLEAAGGTITVITTIAEFSSTGIGSFLYVVAIISANLAVMNLLPIPSLDGSRMVFTLIEMIFRKPVPRKIEAAIHVVGLVLILVLAVFLDVFHLVRG